MRIVVVAMGLVVVACAGTSSRSDDRSSNGGSLTGGNSTGGTAPTGGSSPGGANPAGGTAGSGGTNPSGGSDPSGGSGATGGAMPSGGTIGEGGAEAGAGNVGGEGATAGSGGMAGSGATAGGGASGASGGSSGACTTPNPAGCPQVPCASDETCWMRQADCRPGSCTCSEAGEWVCTRDCGGGVCRSSSCPAGCEPTESTCTAGGTDRVTWVCYPNGTSFGYQELMEAGCQDLATQVPRFCCPAAFKPECAVEGGLGG